MRRSGQDPCSAASDLAFSSSSSGLRAGWDRSQSFGISSLISVIESVKAAYRRKHKDSETREDEAVVACVYPITISRQFEQIIQVFPLDATGANFTPHNNLDIHHSTASIIDPFTSSCICFPLFSKPYSIIGQAMCWVDDYFLRSSVTTTGEPIWAN